MRMLDLFAGLGGASAAMKDRGWEVITQDINPDFKPRVVCDIRDYKLFGERFDLIWASPPCTEFSKAGLPQSWACNRIPANPTTELLLEAVRVINCNKAKHWIIENVAGARKYFKPIIGEPVKKCGSRYLWGDFPIFNVKPEYGKWRLPPSKDRAAKRSLIPYSLSLAVALAIEWELNESHYSGVNPGACAKDEREV